MTYQINKLGFRRASLEIKIRSTVPKVNMSDILNCGHFQLSEELLSKFPDASQTTATGATIKEESDRAIERILANVRSWEK